MRNWGIFGYLGVLWIGCSAAGDNSDGPGNTTTETVSTTEPMVGASAVGTGGAGGNGFNVSGMGGDNCTKACASDLHSVIDCHGNTLETCSGTDGCDISTLACVNACAAAEDNKQAVGCEYYATYMDQHSSENCFAAFVANTWDTAANITVEYEGTELPIEDFARIPVGSGSYLTYESYDASVGLAPGEVVILFLAGYGGSVSCPITPAKKSGVQLYHKSGIGNSFSISSDVPVVSYQINPYGGGSAAITGASLLLPTSVWDTNYVAVNPEGANVGNPSLNIIAKEDSTTISMVPVASVSGGNGIPSSSANELMTFTLNAGEQAQISQASELTGSVIQSDKPIGLMGGHQCMQKPSGISYCDHAEQMIPPVQSLGSEYVGVMYRPRADEPAIWRLVGTVDGTELAWSSDVGGPATLNVGEVAEFESADPFVVTSQDDDHPFMLFAFMSGSMWTSATADYGDPDFVISVPPKQYLSQYVFFTDPTYPETNLVVVRSKKDDEFHDVTLDCAGVLTDWQAIGEYEWTRIDLSTGDFEGVNGCSNGAHAISSDAPFGLWVWGWGTPETSSFTANVSYGYPGGMNVQPINQVIIDPQPN